MSEIVPPPSLDVEKQTIELFAALTKIKTQPCGLFIDPNIPYLGATPDAQIFPDGLIEVKCPYGTKDVTVKYPLLLQLSNLTSLFSKLKIKPYLSIGNISTSFKFKDN